MGDFFLYMWPVCFSLFLWMAIPCSLFYLCFGYEMLQWVFKTDSAYLLFSVLLVSISVHLSFIWGSFLLLSCWRFEDHRFYLLTWDLSPSSMPIIWKSVLSLVFLSSFMLFPVLFFCFFHSQCSCGLISLSSNILYPVWVLPPACFSVAFPSWIIELF